MLSSSNYKQSGKILLFYFSLVILNSSVSPADREWSTEIFSILCHFAFPSVSTAKICLDVMQMLAEAHC